MEVLAPPSAQILCGEAARVLRSLPAESVHAIVTSPPYFAQRDYGSHGQLGAEPSVAGYVAGWRRSSTSAGGCCAARARAG